MSFPKYENYKDSGIGWLGEVPTHWAIKSLKSILIERKEKNDPIKTTYILSLTMDKGVIPYSERGGGGNKAKEDLTAYKLAYPNDIVLNSMNVVVGSVGLSKYFGAVSPVYYMLYPRKKGDKVEYFSHIFQSETFQKSLLGLGNGILMKESESSNKLNTIRMRIPMEKLNTQVLPYPSEEEQKTIAAFLDREIAKIDTLIAEQKNLIELLKEKRQAVISHAITKGLNPDAPMKDSGIEWLGEVPEHWEVKRLRFIAQLNPSKSETAEIDRETEVSFLPMETIGDDGSLNLERTRLIGEVENGYTYFREGDVTIAKITPCFENCKGAIMRGLLGGIGFGTTELIVVRPILSETTSNYLHSLFISTPFRKRGEASMYGAGGQKRVPDDFVRNFAIGFPPIQEQFAITDFLDHESAKLDALTTEAKRAITILLERRAVLISAAVTGKIDVRGLVDEKPEVEQAA
jgi:type I restriction enzyme S subunit